MKELIDSPLSFDVTLEYPTLRHPINGPELIEIDFNCAYPNHSSCFENEYAQVVKEIVAFAKSRPRKSKEMKGYLDLIDNTVDHALKVLPSLNLLPLLLSNPAQISVINNNSKLSTEKSRPAEIWKPSKSESQKAFILLAIDESELEIVLAERKSDLEKYGLLQQPMLAIVENNGLIKKSFVVINDFKYDITSPLQAFDVTYKSFFSLQFVYPKECLMPWMEVSNLSENTGVDVSNLNNMIDSLSMAFDDIDSDKKRLAFFTKKGYYLTPTKHRFDNRLQEGIELSISQERVQIFFKLGLIVGDNLGLHGILGFTESFNANYACRFCKMNKFQRSIAIQEDEVYLRTKENYERDNYKSLSIVGDQFILLKSYM
ncbi:hypothetical protein TKK_0005103 [Trichogramma kaykai]